MITITGLGPGDFDRIPAATKRVLLDPMATVVVRTIEHPAAMELARMREVVSCDDLYQGHDTFDEVYQAIADRVLEASAATPVVYAVPGSPMVGELAVRRLLEAGVGAEVIPAESFVDAVLADVGYDPLDRGLQLLNAHDLPDPLVLDKPTVVAQLDRPEIMAEVAARIARVLPEDAVVTVLVGAGSSDGVRVEATADGIDSSLAGYRTSLFIDSEPGGLIGAVRTMSILRVECPWDREQTHQSLVKYLVEETYELIDAVSKLARDEADWVTYAEVEDELGDVLLSVLFHAAIARQNGAFDIDDVAEVMRQKLVRRHPHVFGDVDVDSAADVKRNWDQIKDEERGATRESLMDGVPPGMPALQRASKVQNRAAKVGFDWARAAEVVPKIREELDELEAVLGDPAEAESELGDVLFSMLNLARHLGVDGEIALRRAIERFDARFRHMEEAGPLEGLSLEELNQRWEEAKPHT
ncbi:MAG TPA: nucleoside triphosphate pyrophosphohydrolase [Acidimicrobiia bacterium]|nr:nucleoside triphosphate pyrophosphohydrolase [Acidimicrobiia bacterium]